MLAGKTGAATSGEKISFTMALIRKRFENLHSRTKIFKITTNGELMFRSPFRVASFAESVGAASVF
jgi:hypothetical protein